MINLTNYFIRSTLLLLILGILYSPAIRSQTIVNNLNVPTNHPRLVFTAQSLQDAQLWHQNNPFPVSNAPVLSIYDGQDAVDLAFKYLVSDTTLVSNAVRTDYARRAIEWAKLALAEIDAVNYGTGNNTCNECRWYSEQMFLVIDWCFDELTTTEWNDFYTTLNQVIPQWNNASWGNPTMVRSNYNHGYARQSIEWALLIYHEDSTLATSLLDHAMNSRWANFEAYAQNRGISGIPVEGTSYAYTILTYHLYAGLSLRNAGLDYFTSTDYFKKAIAHTIYNLTPQKAYIGPNVPSTENYLLPFPYGDAGGFMNVNPWSETINAEHAEFMLMSGIFWQGIGHLPEYAIDWVDRHDLYSQNYTPPYFVQALTDHLPQRDLTENPLDYFGPGGSTLPYAYSKNSWGPEATSVFMQLGKPTLGGHEHMDAGNFTLVKGNRYLVAPPPGRGYGSGWNVPDYDTTSSVWVNESLAKNTILFGTEGSVSRGETLGNVDRMQHHNDFFYVANDLTPAYKAATNPSFDNHSCEHFTREFIFIKPLETLIVFDRTKSDPNFDLRKTALLHVQGMPTIQNPRKFVSTNNDYEAIIDVFMPNTLDIKIIDETHVTGYSPRDDEAHRLQMENSDTGTVYFLNVIQSKDINDTEITVNFTETASTIRLEFSHPTKGFAVVEFDKGLTSNGGRIAYQTNSLPVSLDTLYSYPHTITVTDDGPEWAGTLSSVFTPPATFKQLPECRLATYSLNSSNLDLYFEDYVNKEVNITIYGMDGKTHYQTTSYINADQHSLQVPSSLHQGIYLLKVDANDCSQTLKIVKYRE